MHPALPPDRTALPLPRWLPALLVLLCTLASPAFGGESGARACASPPVLVQSDGKAVRTLSREVSIETDCLAKNGEPTRGIIWFDEPLFADGTIELDIKGRNEQGKSFVGLAFHASDPLHYDAIYFRPFNFRNPERQGRSIQYTSMPAYPWSILREKFPGRYEHAANTPLDPDDWFHVRIEVKHPQVRVFVNGQLEPSLAVTQLSSAREGRIGLWTDNNEGHFRNLSIVAAQP